MRQSVNEPSRPPSRYATCEWFYHVPFKQTEMKTKGSIAPISQISGLSDLAEPHNELKNEGNKRWIKKTDSEYVKLAKQGGRPDLLKHIDPPMKIQQISYAPPDWYSHEPLTIPPESAVAPLRNVPDYMIHEEFSQQRNDEKYKVKRGPFDFDQKTMWQRDLEDNEKENSCDIKVKLPAINPKPMNANAVNASEKGPSSTKSKGDKLGKKCFFPPMPKNKNDSINIGKLLSNGYEDEWKHGEQNTKPIQKAKMKGTS
ncbi:Chromosome 7 open reading frame 57, partial [Pristimantis euphronides]